MRELEAAWRVQAEQDGFSPAERQAGARALAFAAEEAWRWYAAHRRDVVIRRRVFGLFSVTVLVKDLRFLVVALFGEPPAIPELADV